MKKLFTRLFLGIALLATVQANAQFCTFNPTVTCGLPSSTYGFGNLDSIPCVVPRTMTDIVIPFKCYNQFPIPGGGGNATIYKLILDSINNLPCGLCWSTNHIDNAFLGGDFGCIQIQGYSTDAPGQYKLDLWLSVSITAGPNDTTDAACQPANGGVMVNADEGGIYLFLRVDSADGNCLPVDTNTGSIRRTASCQQYYAGITVTPQPLRNLTIQPNPLSSSAAVRFTSEAGGTENIRVINIIGSEVYNTTMTARSGDNETTINRNDLPTGVYILSVSGKEGMVTKKFIIEE